MKVPLIAQPPRETAYARRFALFILAAVVFLAVPAYICRELTLVRAGPRHPVSYLLPVGEQFNPRHLIHRLNPHGKAIRMRDVLAARTANPFDADAVPFPPGKKTVVTFAIDGTERHVVVYVPTSYPETTVNASAQVGMMVLFHGLNDNCDHFLDATGFVPHAEEEGFIIASACGSQGYLGTAWNSGMCCGFSGDEPNDIGFAQTIVQEMVQAVRVDAERVMAVGFSNGAMLTEVLACAATNSYRAVASIGGVVELRPGNDKGLAQCTALTAGTPDRTSVLMVHGTADVMVPWGGNSFLGFPPIESNLASWVERNGCPTDSGNSTIHTKTYTNTIYANCDAHHSKQFVPTDKEELVILAPELEEKVLENDGTLAPEDAGEAPPSERAHVEVLAMKKAWRFERALERNYHHRHHHGFHKWFKKHRHHRKDDAGDDDGDAPAENKHNEHNDHEEEHERESEEMRHREHHHGRGPHRRGGKHPHLPLTTTAGPIMDDIRTLAPKERAPAVPRLDGSISQIELVRVEGGAHRWPEDNEFSTTEYIVEFGARVFGRYN